MKSRRTSVPFDPYYFEKHARKEQAASIHDTFNHIYRTNHWNGSAGVSGQGATENQTEEIRTALPDLIQKLNVQIMLDLPCGDFSWMQTLELPITTYIGADIVTELIEQNQARFGTTHRRFVPLDLTQDPLPAADLLFCRDCFVHLSFADIFRALDQVKQSPIPYLLTTTFTACETNEDIVTGDWRVLNLEKTPFNFPPPERLINEHCSEGNGLFNDKSLGLWPVHKL